MTQSRRTHPPTEPFGLKVPNTYLLLSRHTIPPPTLTRGLLPYRGAGIRRRTRGRHRERNRTTDFRLKCKVRSSSESQSGTELRSSLTLVSVTDLSPRFPLEPVTGVLGFPTTTLFNIPTRSRILVGSVSVQLVPPHPEVGLWTSGPQPLPYLLYKGVPEPITPVKYPADTETDTHLSLDDFRSSSKPVYF